MDNKPVLIKKVGLRDLKVGDKVERLSSHPTDYFNTSLVWKIENDNIYFIRPYVLDNGEVGAEKWDVPISFYEHINYKVIRDIKVANYFHKTNEVVFEDLESLQDWLDDFYA